MRTELGQNNSNPPVPEKEADLSVFAGTKPSAFKATFLSALATLMVFLIIPLSGFQSLKTGSFVSRPVDPVPFPTLSPEPFVSPAKKAEQKHIEKPVFPRTVEKPRLFPLKVSLDLQLDPTPNDLILGVNLNPGISGDDLIFELAEIDVPPEPLIKISPVYPIQAKLKGIEGRVELLFIVNVRGEVDQVQIPFSEPGDVFISSAMKAIKKWKFNPGKKNEKAVAVWVKLPLIFTLEGNSK